MGKLPPRAWVRCVVAVGLLATSSMAVVELIRVPDAMAQRRRKPKAAPPKPEAGKPSEGAGETSSGDGSRADASAPSGAPSTMGGLSQGAAAANGGVRPGDGDDRDGGTSASNRADATRLSPLTPTPAEARGAVADAGVPLDYDRLLGDVTALRARVAAVADTLFKSRIQVALRTEGDRMIVRRLVVTLDDGPVYISSSDFRAEDFTVVYDHAVAPGKHAVGIDVERADAKDQAFRSETRARYVLEVPRDQLLKVELRVGDDSTMGHEFGSDKEGRYDTRVRVHAVAKPVRR
jgi:hypothetical protein